MKNNSIAIHKVKNKQTIITERADRQTTTKKFHLAIDYIDEIYIKILFKKYKLTQ